MTIERVLLERTHGLDEAVGQSDGGGAHGLAAPPCEDPTPSVVKICALIAFGHSSRASLTAGSRPPADVIRALLSSTDERNAGVTALSSVSR